MKIAVTLSAMSFILFSPSLTRAEEPQQSSVVFVMYKPNPVVTEDQENPPPDIEEVSNHIEQNWSNWSERFAASANRKGQNPEFVSVESLECSWTDGRFIDCDIEVKGQFEDGVSRTATLPTMFDLEPDHRLRQVILMTHPRPIILLAHPRPKLLEVEPVEIISLEPTDEGEGH